MVFTSYRNGVHELLDRLSAVEGVKVREGRRKHLLKVREGGGRGGGSKQGDGATITSVFMETSVRIGREGGKRANRCGSPSGWVEWRTHGSISMCGRGWLAEERGRG